MQRRRVASGPARRAGPQREAAADSRRGRDEDGEVVNAAVLR